MAPNDLRGPFAVVNYVFGALFFVSALLQLNDPDPWAWAALYAAAGAACLVGRRAFALVVAVLAASTAWALWLAPQAIPKLELRDLARTMHAETPSIELGRELIGLVIVALWMGVLVWRLSRVRRAHEG